MFLILYSSFGNEASVVVVVVVGAVVAVVVHSLSQ